ncbi:MAG: signal peptidase II [Chloroflexi bacterium]|nr:signal peptidase II [Chloroflexota bacterium]
MSEKTTLNENSSRPETEISGAETILTTNLGFNDYIQNYLFLLLIALPIVTLDQWTKGLVRTHLGFYERWMPIDWLEPYARIIRTQNSGAAFGMFKQGADLFTILAIVVIAIILIYFPRVSKEDWPLRFAMGFQLAGAAGNLIDRLNHGSVTDFISVGNFPVFNIADASISFGVAILLLGVWYLERQEKAKLEIVGGDEFELEIEEESN